MKLSGYMLLCFAFLALFCNSQQFEVKYLVDDFSVGQEIIITLGADVNTTEPPVFETSFVITPTNTTLGGERDMEVRVTQGSFGRSYTSRIPDSEPIWIISNYKNSLMSATNQYDGVDQSFDLNFNGLNVDLTEVSKMTAFYILDLDSTMLVNLYDFSGTACSNSQVLPAANDPVETSIDVSSFVGNCNQETIGAIEISIETDSSADATFFNITLDGLPATPTPTQTPPPTPTQTRFPTSSVSPTSTRVSAITGTPTPTNTPTSTLISQLETPTQTPTQTSTSVAQVNSPTQTQTQTPTQTPTSRASGSATPTGTVAPTTTATRTAAPVVSTQITEGEGPVVLSQPETGIEVAGDPIVFGENSVLTISGVTQVLPEALAVASSAVDVNLFNENGNAIQPDGEVIICFPPIADSNLDRYCLAHLDEELNTWICDNNDIQQADGQLCSSVDHFTVFALIDRFIIGEISNLNSYSLVSSRTTDSYSLPNTNSLSSYSTGGFTYTASPDEFNSSSSNGYILSATLSLTILAAIVTMI